jgi:hypothetical protein
VGALPKCGREACTAGLETTRSILQRTSPELVVSKYRLRQVDGISLIRQNREVGSQRLAFSSRPFVLCGLPYRRPPDGQLLYERRNGHFVLQVTGHPEFGLPFGQDRLVPILLATMAVQQRSQVVRFRSGAEMLDTFGMAKGGKEYRRLVAAFERIFGATIFFGTDRMNSKARVVHRSRFNFLREAQIWYNREPGQPLLAEECPNVIVLSDEFYQEITDHPIPTDLEAVKVFASAPAVLDLFTWLAYRCFIAKSQERIPLFGEFGLAAQLGCVEYSRPRRFRAMLEQWIRTIRAAWPQCPAAICPDGRNLRIGPASAVLRGAGGLRCGPP